MHLLNLQVGVVAGLLAITSATPTRFAERQSEPCARIAAAARAFVSAPDNPFLLVPAELAYNCAMSIPFDAAAALNLTTSLKPYLEFQSNLADLSSPPQGYLYDGVNVLAEVGVMETRIKDNGYKSEFEFQVDLQALARSTKDNHLRYFFELTTIFLWRRQFGLAAISIDGKEVPKVYNFDHVATISGDTIRPKDLAKASEVVEINGIPVQDFVNAEAYAGLQRDPDANWNEVLFRLQKGSGAFEQPAFYPGPTTVLKYANGTSSTAQNYALMNVDIPSLGRITNGNDFYRVFVGSHTTNQTAPSPGASRRSDMLLKRSSDAAEPVKRQQKQLPFYPKAEIIDPSEKVSGYFLAGKDYADIAVLVIEDFLPGGSLSVTDAGLENFQQTVQTFLALAHRQGKTKLIVDLQGNGGGFVDLSLDAYMQLFPQSDGPNTKNNMRASLGMQAVVEASAQVVAQAARVNVDQEVLQEATFAPFAFQSIMKTDRGAYKDSADYYGPTTIGNGQYVNFHQFNYTNDEADELGVPSIVITGNLNRTGFQQYFDAKDIVMLTDSTCGSACTIFAELMKNFQGVRSVSLGGRPQKGYVQSIGGVRGSLLFPSSSFSLILGLIPQMPAATISKFAGTVFQNFNDLVNVRSSNSFGVNGRNAYRIGDDSETCLHFIYEAADCRLFYDLNMTTDATSIWRKTARAMFGDGGIDASICVEGSTGHPTTVSGGLKQGQLGPQTPPSGAKAALGWLVAGKEIIQGSPVGAFTGKKQDRVGLTPNTNSNNSGNNKNNNSNNSNNNGGTTPDSNDGDFPGLTDDQQQALASLKAACRNYQGEAWLVSLFCGAFR